jgi:hypothetical protein
MLPSPTDGNVLGPLLGAVLGSQVPCHWQDPGSLVRTHQGVSTLLDHHRHRHKECGQGEFYPVFI